MYCKQCGSQINVGAKFCKSCGSPVCGDAIDFRENSYVATPSFDAQQVLSMNRMFLRQQAEQNVEEARRNVAYVSSAYSNTNGRVDVMKALGAVAFLIATAFSYYSIFTQPVEGNIIVQLYSLAIPFLMGLAAAMMAWGLFAVADWVNKNVLFASFGGFLLLLILLTIVLVVALAMGAPYFDEKKKEAKRFKGQLERAKLDLAEKEELLRQIEAC